jgi:hypothetical protein
MRCIPWQAGEAAGGAASVAAQYPGVTAGVAGAGALALALRSFNDRWGSITGHNRQNGTCAALCLKAGHMLPVVASADVNASD